MISYICPFTSFCDIYKNWNQKTGRNDLDLIKYDEKSFRCIALDKIIEDVIYDEENLEEISKRIVNPDPCFCIIPEIMREIILRD